MRRTASHSPERAPLRAHFKPRPRSPARAVAPGRAYHLCAPRRFTEPAVARPDMSGLRSGAERRPAMADKPAGPWPTPIIALFSCQGAWGFIGRRPTPVTRRHSPRRPTGLGSRPPPSDQKREAQLPLSFAQPCPPTAGKPQGAVCYSYYSISRDPVKACYSRFSAADSPSLSFE